MKATAKQPNFKKRKVDPRARSQRYPSEQTLDAIAASNGRDAGDQPVKSPSAVTGNFPLKWLEPSSTNPRQRFDEEALKQLAADLKANGLIQHLVVREKRDEVRADGKPLYEIVCGERRWRAALLAGWQQIQCRVVDWTDDEVIERQIAENDQRSDLTEIERALAYQRLLDTGLTQEQLATKLGRTQGFVANAVSLLKLPKKARAAVEAGVVSATCARLLVPACHVPAIVDDMLKFASRQAKQNGGQPATVKEWESKFDTVINNHTVPISGGKYTKDGYKEFSVPVTDANREALALVPGRYGKRSANPKLVAKLKAEQTRKANARAAKAEEGDTAKTKKDAAQKRYEAAQVARQVRDAVEQLVEDVQQLAIAQAFSYTAGERPDEHVVLRLLIFAGLNADWDRHESVFPGSRRSYGPELSKVQDADLSATALRLVQTLFVDKYGPIELGDNELVVEWAAAALGLTDVRRSWPLAVDHPWLKKEWAKLAGKCGRDDDEQKAGPPAKCPEWLLPPTKKKPGGKKTK